MHCRGVRARFDLTDLPAEEALLWQSRTRFGGIAQDWTTYPREAQARLNRAHVRGDETVELCFGSSRFRVDLMKKKQYNTADITKVRDVRLASVQPKMWLLISKREEAHWVALDEANCKDIEEGLGERHLCHDAVLFEILNRRLGRGSVPTTLSMRMHSGAF
ncbi:unnamed protein product [Symbiodinium sp. CCMP2592]|nr:unnamed protein product [Symbiodinium sp. CCMP2592]